MLHVVWVVHLYHLLWKMPTRYSQEQDITQILILTWEHSIGQNHRLILWKYCLSLGYMCDKSRNTVLLIILIKRLHHFLVDVDIQVPFRCVTMWIYLIIRGHLQEFHCFRKALIHFVSLSFSFCPYHQTLFFKWFTYHYSSWLKVFIATPWGSTVH